MSWYLAVLKNYGGFDGRARRKEYWMFTLFHIFFLIDSCLGCFSEKASRYWKKWLDDFDCIDPYSWSNLAIGFNGVRR